MANKENMAAFVQELRTTQTPQTRGYLNVVRTTCAHSTVGRCCLGVACDMVPNLAKKQITVWCPSCSMDMEIMVYGKEEADAVLPEEAMEWLGVSVTVPTITAPEWEGGHGIGATFGNDTLEMTFAELGDGFAQEYLDQ